MKFLKRLSEDIGLEFRVECPVSELKPVVVLSWIGTQPELESIILNSHMDVVPVFEVRLCSQLKLSLINDVIL